MASWRALFIDMSSLSKRGRDCVSQFDDWYSIIGRRTPKMIDDLAKAEKYQKRYDALVEKYKNRENPPSDSEKD